MKIIKRIMVTPLIILNAIVITIGMLFMLFYWIFKGVIHPRTDDIIDNLYDINEELVEWCE